MIEISQEAVMLFFAYGGRLHSGLSRSVSCISRGPNKCSRCPLDPHCKKVGGYIAGAVKKALKSCPPELYYMVEEIYIK